MENINLWEVMTNYEAEKKFAVFLTNEDGEITPNQIPFFNVFFLSSVDHRPTKSQSVALVRCVETIANLSCTCVVLTGLLWYTCTVLSLVNVSFRTYFYVVFCLNTPEMRLFDANDEVCGVVKSVFNCCDRVFYITDEKNEECMTINGSCCQAGNFCFCPCSPCDE